MSKDLSVRLIIPVLFLIILSASSPIQATEEYLFIDLTDVTIGETRGTAPSPFHLSRDLISEEYFISILTLNSLNGAQLGTTLKLSTPADDVYPAAILWSEHFMPTITRGIAPSPFIVMTDYTIYHFPLAHETDGTPLMAGDWETISLLQTPDMYGDATCAAELPGSEFGDGKPRLYIGTDEGHIFWLVETAEAGIVVEGDFWYSYGRIDDLEPIPQYGYIALGALAGNAIYGFDHRTTRDGDNRYMYNFRLIDPRTPPITDFDVIGPNDEQLPGPDYQVSLILANGSNELGIASISGMAEDDITLEITPDTKAENISKIASGSLLMIPTDYSTVLYDPHFNGDDGSSECESELIGVPPDPCHNICGDVDNDGLVNILDIVYLLNYKYKEGPAPYILRLGDIDGIDPINILDIVYLINYKYKEGPNPACP